MEFLKMTKRKVQAWFEGALPLPADEIVVGAAIIRTRAHGNTEILLLRRATQQTCYPDFFELPGGAVDEVYGSLRDALIREVYAATGLLISGIRHALDLFTYTIEERTSKKANVRELALQLTYFVKVQDFKYDFVLIPDVHSEGIWATADEVPALPMTDKTREIVLEALWFANNIGHHE